MTTITGTLASSPVAGSITYDELRRRLGRYLGLSTDTASWTASEVSAVDDAILRGVRSFYFPDTTDPHYWSFLRKTVTITLVDGTQWYDMPSDFIALETIFSLDNQSGHAAINQIDAVNLRTKTASEGVEGTPNEVAVRSKGSGKLYQAGFYPIPNAAIDLDCWYIHSPADLSLGNQNPEGGNDHSETIAAACMAAAELELKPESIGEGGSALQQLFQSLLAKSIARDNRLQKGGAA